MWAERRVRPLRRRRRDRLRKPYPAACFGALVHGGDGHEVRRQAPLVARVHGAATKSLRELSVDMHCDLLVAMNFAE